MINLLNDLLDISNESYEMKRLEKELFNNYPFSNDVSSLKKIIEIINNIYKVSNIDLTLRFYSCSEALKEIKNHKGEVFIDLNKTFLQDCLWKE